ncbi:MAG: GAF domain-containing protein, partial [Anaerolineae bacterium]|nr:GAF domain-containing protein [Anaerolineae bacterium]
MNSYAGPDGAPTPVRIPSSRRHGAHRAPSVILYDALVALAGWGSLVWLSLRAGQAPWALPVLLFLLLAAGLKREGFRVARLVTHSLAGVAVLAALIAIGPAGGAWVAGLSGWLVLVSRPAESGERPGLGRWRLALFGGGLNALVALAGAELYVALGGRWGLQALRGADLAAVAGLSLAWFLGDHLGWCLRIYFLEGQAGVRRFLLTIGPYSLAVELLPLPLAAVLAACYAALGTLAFVLLGLFLVGVAQVLRLLVAALNRVRQRVADLTTLEACSRALLASKLDVKELCRLLHEHTAAIVDAHAFWLGLTGGSEGSLEVALATDRAAPSDGARWAPTPELVAWVRRERAALLVRDATQEELPFGRETLAGGSALVVPMQAGGALLGLLVVRHPSPNAYSRDDLRSVVAYANQAAMAIGNARSLEAEQRRVRQITTVGEVSRRVVAMLGMDQLFAEVVALIRDAFGYYHVQLFTVDPVSGAVEFRASTNERIQQHGLQVAAGQGLVGWVAQTGEQVVVNDVASEGRYRPIEGLEGARAEAVVPLKVDERLVGILEVLSERAGAFGEEDLFVLRTLSDQVAIAIEDNRLYRAERARRRLADTLRETATALNSTLELRAVLDLVLTQLERVIRYDAAAILEWEEGRFCVIAGRGKYATPETCLAAEEGAELRRLV